MKNAVKTTDTVDEDILLHRHQTSGQCEVYSEPGLYGYTATESREWSPSKSACNDGYAAWTRAATQL